jgi:alkylhydroperoxidase family enzyme
MPRLPTVAAARIDASGEPFASAAADGGLATDAVLTMAHVPDIMRAYIGLWKAVMGTDRKVPRTLKWMVAHVASRSAGCPYWAIHAIRNATMVEGSAFDRNKIAAIRDYERSPQFTEAEKAALRVAWGAAALPNDVTDADFHRLKTHFDTTEIVEILAVVALFGFLARWTETLKVELEPAVLDFAAKHNLDEYGLIPAPRLARATAGQAGLSGPPR